MASITSILAGNKPAGIQYIGLAGVSASCIRAVRRILQYGDRVVSAKLLTSHQSHCLLLELDSVETMAVKSGFASGYGGEGPRALATVLNMLYAQGAEINEYKVSSDLLERLDASALTIRDLDSLDTMRPVRPNRWYDYIFDAGVEHLGAAGIWHQFDPTIPWAIIDPRIADLALNFFEDPDRSISTGFRRLEDIVRKRINDTASSVRLFAIAFQGDKSKLFWGDIDSGEHNGRGQLFSGAYMAYRNPRAHKELKDGVRAALSEFVLLNQLYVLEGEAIERPSEN